ncbi:transposase, partial [Clostridium tarantellae]
MSSLLEKSVNFNSKIKINFEGGNLTSDSGFANPELFKLIEENKAFYAIRLKANSSLYAKSEDLTKKM